MGLSRITCQDRETMTTVKKIINPTGDQGSQEAFRTASNLKSSAGDLSQLAKLTKNYCQANQHSIDAGKQLVDHLVKITTKMEQRLGAVSQSLIEISSTEKTIFSKMDELVSFITLQLIIVEILINDFDFLFVILEYNHI